MKCNAKTRSGGLCKVHRLKGRSRCRLHGGLSPSGEAHWNYRHGNRTKEAIARNALISNQIEMLEAIGLSIGLFSEYDL